MWTVLRSDLSADASLGEGKRIGPPVSPSVIRASTASFSSHDTDRLPSDDVKDPHSGQVFTYFVMVGEDGSVELSCPLIANKRYAEFVERIFIDRPDDEWDAGMDPETGPVEDFDVPVVLKDRAA